MNSLREAVSAARQTRESVIQPRPLGLVPPASLTQEAILGESSAGADLQRAYLIPRLYRLRGDVDVKRLQEAFRSTIARHESMHAKFVSSDERTLLRFERVDAFELHDTTIAGSVNEEIVRSRGRQLIERVLASSLFAPPVTAELLHHPGTDGSWLLVVFNHLFFDGPSQSLFWSDLSADYEGRMRTPSSTMLQYGDFTVWEEARRCSETAASDTDFWIGEAARCPEGLTFPPPPVLLEDDQIHTLEGAATSGSTTVDRALPASLSTTIDALAMKLGVSRAACMLFGYQLLLAVLNGSDTASVGLPVSLRRRPELAGCIGLLVNTHFTRIELAAGGSVGGALQGCASSLTQTIARRETALPHVYSEVLARNQLASMPHRLFRVLFTFNSYSPTVGKLGGVSVEQLTSPESGGTITEVMLQVISRQGNIRTVWNFDARKYTHQQIKTIATSYELVLGVVAHNPDSTFAEVRDQLQRLVATPAGS